MAVQKKPKSSASALSDRLGDALAIKTRGARPLVKPRTFSKILVANRGEIALRIIRACREMGLETVAVYSEADRGAPHTQLASEAICIGPPAPAQSYLRADRIIAAAEVANVDAIHPGYGFLAENPDFAEQCRSSKIEFIGPAADTIRMLGDKAAAKRLARKVHIKTVPGSDDVIEEDEEAVKLGEEIGYPVMIKAAAGGGGRGMRIAHNEATLRTQLRNARTEAENAFKDGRVYIEKLVEQPRHVEVQILADQHGNRIHLWERDCTLQRRHQKLVEESPSPAINGKTREAICKAAVKLVEAADYFSAGTVEFIVDRQGEFFFLEVNTRIQVEHPVTEMLTGVDLIKWMVRIAAGEKLTLRQKDIQRNGAVIEVRVNAEDPEHGFRPSPGRITEFRAPGGFGVRIDTHVSAGCEISPYYDSLIGKLIVQRPTRDEAIFAMRRCLDELHVAPIHTTVGLLKEIFSHSEFHRGRIDTGFIERLMQESEQRAG
jgi:acetyl-CoA carboxylase biotin carboxylase subunit